MEGRKSGETLHYVGKILSDQEERFQIDFLRVKPGMKDKFMYPESRDILEVEKERVLGVLSVCKLQYEIIFGKCIGHL